MTELEPLTRDLPAAVPARSPERELAQRRLMHRGGAAAMTSIVCVVVWLATGASGHFWPVWVIAFSFLALGREAWATLGPGADLPEVRDQQGRHDRHRRRHRHRRW